MLPNHYARLRLAARSACDSKARGRWLLGLALLAPGIAPAQETVADAAAPDSDEVAAFKEAQSRFSERMRELEQDTRAYVDEREKSERAKIEASYDAQIDVLTQAERDQRQTAIERFEDFLLRYSDTAHASHVRFRLAELYWEEAREEWLQASAEYFALEERFMAGENVELPEPPMMDLAKVVAQYERIIEDNTLKSKEERYEFLDGTYYSLGFVYKEETAAQYDEEKAKAAFTTLLEVAPDSPYADDAHLNLGNFMFEANDFDGAIAKYRIVYGHGPEGRLYGDAMYQLAWAYYKKSVYDRPEAGDPPDATALSMFAKLLDWSEQEFLETGKRSDYSPDAIKFMAFSFVDIAGDRQDPTAVAEAWFAKNGAKDYEWDVYVALAQALTDYGRFEHAINVYRKLQRDDRWRLRPENPEFQMQIVKLLASGAEQDLAASAAARIELTERYNDQSEWWQANRHNPDALASARRYIEDSLADVAIEYRKNADNDGTPESYALAATKFQEYLDKFPISDDYFVMQWYLADTLYRAKNYAGAAKEYGNLVKSGKHHQFRDGSMYQLMLTSLQVATEKHGPTGQAPASPTIERTYTTPGAATVQVYALPPEHQAYIAAADAAVAHEFKGPYEPPPPQPDWADAAGKNRAAMMYIPAQILFYHNRYDEARPRLLAIIEQLPRTDEASYAARLLVDSYLAENDLAQVRLYTKRFIANRPGAAGDVGDESVEIFKDVLEGATFKQAKALSDSGEKEAAAEAYLAFIAEFPESEHVKTALYNAANNYDIVGNVGRSNELYEQYVNTYPDDERSANLYYRIAANYESTFDLSKAIDYYGRLLKNFPKDPNAADALYNTAFLKVGLGDHAGAAKGFEAYAAAYPERPDAADVLFQAGEQYELVSNMDGIAFYERYRRKYGTAKPTQLLEADYRIAKIYEKAGNTSKHNSWLDVVQEDFDKVVADGKSAELTQEARHYAAEAAFRDIQADYDKLTKDKLSGNEAKDAKLLADKEVAVNEFREKALAMAGKYQDFEYTTAVLYLRAKALLYYAELGFSLRPPSGLSEDEQWAYQDILDQEVYPKFYTIQDKAKAEFQKMIDLSKEKKQYSPWITRSYETLNDLDPFAYPAVKEELRGATDSSLYPTIKPVKIDAKDRANEGGAQ